MLVIFNAINIKVTWSCITVIKEVMFLPWFVCLSTGSINFVIVLEVGKNKTRNGLRPTQEGEICTL